MTDPDFVRETLQDLKARDLYRRLVAVGSAAGPHLDVGGQRLLQFASNNYLGLANDERVREAAVRAVAKWGWGAGASRLMAGHTEAHAALEADLAAFKGTEAALVFATGYMANLGVLTALAGRGDTVVGDRENHASIYDAVRLSGAKLRRYAHGDAAAASRLLNPQSAIRNPQSKQILVTDTVFSMGGDLAPLADLAAACRSSGAMLVVDEAHALGLLGPTGAGLAEQVFREPATAVAGSQPAAPAAGSSRKGVARAGLRPKRLLRQRLQVPPVGKGGRQQPQAGGGDEEHGRHHTRQPTLRLQGHPERDKAGQAGQDEAHGGQQRLG